MFVLFIARDTIFRRVAGISLVDRGGRVLCVYTRVLHSKTLYTANDSKWKFLPDLRNRQLTAYTTPSPFIKHSNTERWPSNRGVLSPPDKSPPMHHHFKDSRIFANFPTSYRSFASYTRTIRVVRIYIYISWKARGHRSRALQGLPPLLSYRGKWKGYVYRTTTPRGAWNSGRAPSPHLSPQ